MSVADQHVQGIRSDRTWGCLCGWKQDKPHREHVADMVAAAGPDTRGAVIANTLRLLAIPNGNRTDGRLADGRVAVDPDWAAALIVRLLDEPWAGGAA